MKEPLTPQQKIEHFFKQYKSYSLKKNETILRPDENPNSIYYLKKGYVRLHTYSNEGKELTAIILQPGEVFPLGLIVNETSTNEYWYESITPVEIFKAPLEDFRSFIQHDIDIYGMIASQSIVHLNALLYRMQHIILGKAKTTVASVVWIYSKLLGTRKGNEIYFKLPITHQHISFSAGITRETTSLEIKRLEKEGIIAYQGRKLIVKDVDALWKEAYI